jgi:hypothetical protein
MQITTAGGLLYLEGIFSDVCEEIDLLARQVWNYGYFKTIFAVDDFCLGMTLACVFNDPPHLGVSYPHTGWRPGFCVAHHMHQ